MERSAPPGSYDWASNDSLDDELRQVLHVDVEVADRRAAQTATEAALRTLVADFAAGRRRDGVEPQTMLVELKRRLATAGLAPGVDGDGAKVSELAVRWAIEAYFADDYATEG